MIDPLTSLAFAVSSGSHALLLGSGVSRAAGIPTGWEVLQDLIRKVAGLAGEAPDDPVAWYRESFGTDPTYGGLLESLAPKPAERGQLLRSYFEPNEQEREEGRKLPTAAHDAIARLVARGNIRVVLTPNFDRLAERALQAAGVEPIVVTPSNAGGAPPLSQARALVVKAHGDYLDLRTRNTAAELDAYERPMRRLVTQVVDEFGLVVCGWSADWDGALRRIIEEAPARRYTMYWTHRGEIQEDARRVIAARAGVALQIESADSFFADLADRVEALADLGRSDPVSATVAVAAMKQHIVDPQRRIRLRDSVSAEVDRVLGKLSLADFPVTSPGEVSPELGERLAKYEARTAVLQAVMATGGFWGDSEHAAVWEEAIERVGNLRQEGDGLHPWIDLLRYPAMLMLYAAGIGAVASQRWDILSRLLKGPVLRRRALDDQRAGIALTSYAVVPMRWQKNIPGVADRLFPISDHLHAVMREPLRDILPDDDRYTAAFDRYEYLAGVWVGSTGEAGTGSPGGFAYRRVGNSGKRVTEMIGEEAKQALGGWPALVLFDGSFDAYWTAHEAMIRSLGAYDFQLR